MKKLYFSKLLKQRTIILWYQLHKRKMPYLGYMYMYCTFPDYYRNLLFKIPSPMRKRILAGHMSFENHVLQGRWTQKDII